VTAKDLFSNNNRYFPAADDSNRFKRSDGVYYSADDQNYIFNIVQGSWYLMIVCGQAAHIWVCRTTTVSIFEHGIFSNTYTNYSVVIALLLGCFVTYTPGLQGIVTSGNAHSLPILYGSLLVAGVLWIGTEARKWFSRNYADNWWNKNVLGW
jgi:sodium/potassium-transporting ATPase subunit alpha